MKILSKKILSNLRLEMSNSNISKANLYRHNNTSIVSKISSRAKALSSKITTKLLPSNNK